MKFDFLKTTDKSFDATWAWAKRLVNDLNKLSSQVAGSGSAPSGGVMGWPSAAIPEGWLLCDGAGYSSQQYPFLFDAIGYTHGGGGDTFNVPDYRDKTLIGAGTIVALGAEAGADTVTLTTANMPSHTHVVTDPGHDHGTVVAAHNHSVTDPGHAHAITDPGHVHAEGTDAGTTVTVGVAASVIGGNTAAAFTGVTVNSAVTGVTTDNATVGVTVSNAATGVTVGLEGGGTAFSILGPVVGVNIIIKT